MEPTIIEGIIALLVSATNGAILIITKIRLERKKIAKRHKVLELIARTIYDEKAGRREKARILRIAEILLD
ncbi:MAG: hypothetical protein MPK62_12225 [Alphaproteobacteria bacterium]|nr:hypothetical protein [Alphaproteobacteria bacterium]